MTLLLFSCQTIVFMPVVAKANEILNKENDVVKVTIKVVLFFTS